MVKKRSRHSGLIAIGIALAAVDPSAVTAQNCDTTAFQSILGLAGQWSVHAEDRRPDLTYESTTGQAMLTPSLLGCGLFVHYSGGRQGSPYSTASLITMSADGRVELANSDSAHGGILTSAGTVAGGSMTLIRSTPMGQRVLSTRTTYTIASSDSFVVVRELQRSEGASWEVTLRAQYSRIADSSR